MPPKTVRTALAGVLLLAFFSAAVWLSPAASTAPAASAVQTETVFVRRIPLFANDVIYSPVTGSLYVSVPSTAEAGGNTITPVNPATGAVGTPFFVGSEPNKLALASDGVTAYVSLDGASAVRRFNAQTLTAGAQFPVGLESFYGAYTVNDLAVAPGEPNVVAVVRYNPGISPTEAGVAIFDNGVQRPKVGPGHIEGADFVAYSASPAKLYGGGFYYGLRTMNIDATGITSVTKTTFDVGAKIKFDGGLVFSQSGQVINPDAASPLLGTFNVPSTQAFVADVAANRAYYLTFGGSGGLTLHAFEISTFRPLSSQTISGATGSPTTLVRWGSNGLAFRTNSGQLYVIQTTLIPSADPVPSPTPFVSPTPTPSPTPSNAPTFVRKVNLSANDIVYNASTGNVHASLPSAAGASGNSIAPVNATTGAVGTPVFVGSEPNRLALADDNRTLYVHLTGAQAVRRVDLQTGTPGLQFSVGSQNFADMEAVPGSPQSLAVSPGVNFSSGVTVYDDGVARPKVGNGSFYAVLPIEFGASGSVLYGYNSATTGYDLVKFKVDATGVTADTSTRGLISGFSNDIEFAGGLLYSTSGRVVNPEARTVIGTFSGSGGGVFAVDAALGRIFYLSGDSFGTNKVLRAYDINTFLPLGSVTLPGVSGSPTRMLRFGANGLAIRTAGGTAAEHGLYLIQSALVNASAPVPTGVQLSSDRLTAFEYTSPLNVTVTRTGDVSAATSVDYATSGGTATPGADYVAASGTLSFAAGERTRTIPVTILNDQTYEGTAETFNLTLTNPSGGSQLAGPAAAVVTINDDESRPYVSSNSVRMNEGNSGQTEMNFSVRLSNASVEAVSVNFATANGTALAGSDYDATSGVLTFAPGATTATAKVLINGDNLLEPDESFAVNFPSAVNASVAVTSVVGTIANDEPAPVFQFSSASFASREGDGGAVITVLRSNGVLAPASLTYTTSSRSASAGSDYTETTGTVSFAANETSKTFSVPVIDDTASEPEETFNVSLSNPTGGALLGGVTSATVAVRDNDAVLVRLRDSSNATSEGSNGITVSVERRGDASVPFTVDYATTDGTASERKDYTMTLGTLRFEANETVKTVLVLVGDDGHVEGDEFFNFTLSNPSGGGAQLDTQFTSTLAIFDNEFGTPSAANPIDNASTFVRQNYADFLNRAPDAAGLNFWAGPINVCGTDAQCREVTRVNASAAFFLSIEFQETGYLVYRLHQTAFNTEERLRLRTFMADAQEIGRGVQVGVGNWQQQLDTNKQQFVNRFVQRAEFANAHNALTNDQYVDALNARTFDPLAPSTGGALTQAERDQLVAQLAAGTRTRAEVLRAVADNALFRQRQSNKAFVLMQYFGYLRRNPNDAPDANFDGYNFWLTKLNQFGGNYEQAEMVKAFITSIEYRQRFGQ